MSRRRYGRPRRSLSPKRIRGVIRIHAEGRVTEPEYLEKLARRHRDKVRIEFGRLGEGPDSLVDGACKDMDENRRSQRRCDPLYEQVWCVFDVDAHPNISHAVDKALQKGIEIAVSNPCFELWLVLHRQDQTAYIERHDTQRLARNLGLTKGKALGERVFDDLMHTYEDAKKRAMGLDLMHERNHSPPRSNPSTGVWRLVDTICEPSAGET